MYSRSVFKSTLFILAILSILNGQSIQNARLNLDQIDFQQIKSFNIDGQWELYWNRLFHSELLPDSTGYPFDLVNFPYIWNNLAETNPKINNIGYGTYKITLYSSLDRNDLALTVPDFYSAYKLILNDDVIAKNGQVGRSEDETIPFWLPQTVPLKIKRGHNVLLLQISNFHHYKGGPSESIQLGLESELLYDRELRIGSDVFLTGVLVISGFFFLGLYLFGQDEKYIKYFSFFCFTFAYRVIGYDFYFLHRLIDTIPWDITIRLEYLTYYLSTFLFAKYVKELYPDESKEILFKIFYYICYGFITSAILLPPMLFTQIVIIFTLILSVYMIYGITIFVQAWLNKRLGAIYSILSLLMLLLSVIVYLLEYYDFIHNVFYINLISISGFFFFQSLILSYRFASSYKKAMESAKAGIIAKTQFLGTMSHEIRTPMNGVIGASELLDDTELNDEQMEYLKIIKKSSSNLMTIINDILDYTKIESGDISFQFQSINIVELVEEVIYTNIKPTLSKGLDLTYHIDPKLPVILNSDPVRIKQIISNMINNAIKFTHHGYIELNICLSSKNAKSALVEFQIKDTGIGIASDKIPTLFDLFTQVDSSNTREYGGTGLGLSLCRMLVNNLNGKIWVESELGVGSTFHFIVPMDIAEKTEFVSDKFSINRLLKTSIFVKKSAIRDSLKQNLKSWGFENINDIHNENELKLDIYTNQCEFLIIDYDFVESETYHLLDHLEDNDTLKNLKILILFPFNIEINDRFKGLNRDTMHTPIQLTHLYNIIKSFPNSTTEN